MAEKHPHMHGFLNAVSSALQSDAGHVAEGGVAGAAIGGLAGFAGAHFMGGPGYNVAGHHVSQEAAFAAGGALVGGLLGAGGGAFFNHLKNKNNRDYVIVLDRSGHMHGHLWHEANSVVSQVAQEVCKIDRDGVTVVLFAETVERIPNLTDSGVILQKLQACQPGGPAHLAPAMQAAFAEHFGSSKGKETTILVVTAGQPADVNPTVEVIREASNRIKHSKELSITFIQVGDNPEATAFLTWLDKSLGAKHDIVDTLKDDDLKRLNFRK